MPGSIPRRHVTDHEVLYGRCWTVVRSLTIEGARYKRNRRQTIGSDSALTAYLDTNARYSVLRTCSQKLWWGSSERRWAYLILVLSARSTASRKKLVKCRDCRSIAPLDKVPVTGQQTKKTSKQSGLPASAELESELYRVPNGCYRAFCSLCPHQARNQGIAAPMPKPLSQPT